MKACLVQIALALCAWVVLIPVSAATQRTFVASSGDDANPCSLVLPCRSFAAAITKTMPGGEAIVLDSAGYGPVTISQSVSIIAPAGVHAGITVPAGTTGVAITGGSVALRGLTINGPGPSIGYGIRLTGGAELVVEDCQISGFLSFGGFGVSIEAPSLVTISGTLIRDVNWAIAVGYGANATIVNTQITGVVEEGILNPGDLSGRTTNIFIVDTLVAGTGAVFVGPYCVDNEPYTGQTGNITATRVTVTDCLGGLVNRPVASGTMTVSNSVVVGNEYGFHNQSGTFRSLGNNHVSGNTIDRSGTITTIPRH